MKQDLTHILMLLDRSGSMKSVEEVTVKTFNEFVQGQRAVPGHVNLTLILFDSTDPQEKVCDCSLDKVPELTLQTFVPRGSTPLHDAMGQAINELGAKLGKLPEQDRPGKVMFVTLTDGQENCSSPLKYGGPDGKARLAELIEQQQNIWKWNFVFLAANQDAIMTGSQLNIPVNSSMTFAATAGGVRGMSNSLTSYATNYRNASATDAQKVAFTVEERKAAMEMDKK